MTTPTKISCPLRAVTGVWRLTIPPHNRRSGIITPPSHLVHLVHRGSYTMRINGAPFAPAAGDLIYYAAEDTVDWLDNDAPVVFDSIAFTAPDWQMRDDSRRVFHDCRHLRPAFSQIIDAFNAPTAMHPQALRAMLSIWNTLLIHDVPSPETPETAPSLWQRAEHHIRSRHSWRITIDELAAQLRCSRSTLHRACKDTTGDAPATRLRRLRLELARELLLTSPLSITAIAEQLGYGRVQDFSREFHRVVGTPPSDFRDK